MQSQDNNKYQSAFFIVPSHIMTLPGLTLAYLKVYETIFQFWNHAKPCFLSLESISERTSVCKSQVCEALNFFEEKGELERRWKNQIRYFIQPERGIPEKICPKSEHLSARADTSDSAVRSSGLDLSARADTNKKNLNKTNISYSIEQKLYSNSEQQRQALIFREECLSDTKAKELYEQLPEEFKKDTSYLEMYEACVSHNATKAEPKLVGKHKLQCWIKKALSYPKLVEIKKQCSSYMHNKKQSGTEGHAEMLRQLGIGSTYQGELA